MIVREAATPELVDLEPTTDDFRRDVLAGLGARRKSLPCKYLYDARGSQLFESICDQPEYYLTRAEQQILRERASTIAQLAGPQCVLVELGSGSSLKTRLLLDHLASPRAYVPVDISRSALLGAMAGIARLYPLLDITQVCADYTRDGWILPDIGGGEHRRVFFFPGSTIGNFVPVAARAFLRSIRTRARAGDLLVLGVDLVKDSRTLEAAYNDSAGVTSAFNLNLLERANRELGTDFARENFQHRAVFDATASRIEMRLISRTRQSAHLDGVAWRFEPGEWISTEYSYKYTLEDFRQLARAAGFSAALVWTDAAGLFSVHGLIAA